MLKINEEKVQDARSIVFQIKTKIPVYICICIETKLEDIVY